MTNWAVFFFLQGPIPAARCVGEGWVRAAEVGEGRRNQPDKGPISLRRGFVTGLPPLSPPSQVPRISPSLGNVLWEDYLPGGNP